MRVEQLELLRDADHGGRRRNPDRRRGTSRSFFPERRALRFRRSEEDRRKNWTLPDFSNERRDFDPPSFRPLS